MIAPTVAAVLLCGATAVAAPNSGSAVKRAPGWDVQASRDTLNLPGQQSDTEAEPAIAVNPRNRNNVVSTFQVDLSLGAAALGYATSHDGGKSWRTGYLPGTRARHGTFDAAADAGVTFGPDGTVYATGDLDNFGLGASVPSEIAIWVSRDGGKTWSQPVPVFAQRTQFNANGAPYSVPDASLAVVDGSRRAGHHYGRIYVTWDHYGGQAPDIGQVSAAYSDDRGRSWNLGPTGLGYPVDVQAGVTVSSIPLVMPNGDFAVVVGAETIGGQGALTRQRIAIAAGAGSVATGQPLLFTEQYPIGAAVGDAFANYVNDRQNFTAGYTDAAVDPRSGRLYAVWADSRFRTDLGICDIVISSSADGGKTWSQPTRVDQGATNDDIDHYLPSVRVDPDGAVYIAYRQQQDGPNPDGSQDGWAVDTYLQVSHDDAATFRAPLRLNAVSSDLGFAMMKPSVGSSKGLPWLADYEQLAVAQGRVYVAHIEALDFHVAGESPSVPAKWHHQRLFVATVVTPTR